MMSDILRSTFSIKDRCTISPISINSYTPPNGTLNITLHPNDSPFKKENYSLLDAFIMKYLYILQSNIEYQIPPSLQIDSVSSFSLQSNAPLTIVPSKSVSKISFIHPSLLDDRKDTPLKRIAGLDKELEMVKECIALHLQNSKCTRGIILWGPSGTGKSSLMNQIPFIIEGFDNVSTINSITLLSESPEEKIRIINDIFERSDLVLFESIHSIFSSFDKGKEYIHLASVMDRYPKTFCIASTDSIESLNYVIRRPDRFGLEIEFTIPTALEREAILTVCLENSGLPSLASSVKKIASSAHGFVGSDLEKIVRIACRKCHSLRPEGILSDEDLFEAFKGIKPSALKEVILEVPKVKWSQIGGQELTKQKLIEAVEWPLKYPERFLRFGIKPPKGILLYGPPGCSKTLLAKALATESGLNFMAVKGPELLSKWVGDSEKSVRDIFRKARLAAPSIIFFDEFDSIGSKRGGGGSGATDRVLSQLLTEMDGSDPLTNVTIVAATNRPDIIDPALLRPGRFDRQVYVGLPDLEARKEIFRITATKMPFSKDVDIASLTKLTEGYSGAEITALCQEAALKALREEMSSKYISMDHFISALDVVLPRTSQEMIKEFEKFVSKTSK